MQMQSSSADLKRTLIHLQNTSLWLHAADRAEILTYLFSTILVRAATVGINNYKYGTDLSFCEIHHEKRGTHPTVSKVLLCSRTPLGCGLNAQQKESRHQG